MSIRELFSSNLRGLCRERGTLARIERRTGISRVQLSRYLNGTIPNEANLNELAEYFGVEEEELFQRQSTDEPEENQEFAHYLQPVMRQISNEPPARIEEGAYYFYFPMPGKRDFVMQCAMFIRQIGNFTTFRTFTLDIDEAASVLKDFKSIKRGIVLERYGQFYFIGVSLRGSREPVMVVASKLHITVPLLAGRSIVMHGTQAKSLQFVAHRISRPTPTKIIMESCGIKRTSELENGELFTRLWVKPEIRSSAAVSGFG